MRSLLSAGLLENLQIRLKMNELRMIRNYRDVKRIKSVKILDCRATPPFASLHVEIGAKVTTSIFDLRGKKILRHPRNVKDIWSFCRRLGAQTPASGGLAKDVCPNCSAPDKITERGQCGACEIYLMNGSYDWVLMEISKPGDYQRFIAQDKMNLIRRVDPHFDMGPLEDLISVIFWRIQASYFIGSTLPIERFATDQFLEWMKNHYPHYGDPQFYIDVIVETVEVYDYGISREDTDYDEVRARVRWSGRPVQSKLPAELPPDAGGDRSFFDHMFRLWRHKDAKRDLTHDFMGTHCGQCGGPETEWRGNNCTFCGAKLNSGSLYWVLHAIEDFQHFTCDLNVRQDVANVGR